jgi:hypothetical protein
MKRLFASVTLALALAFSAAAPAAACVPYDPGMGLC